jgi:hypothetical protein
MPPQIPNYTVDFRMPAQQPFNASDALRNVMGIAQFKQDAELMPLRKQQMEQSVEAGRREAELMPLRKQQMEQSVEAGRREAGLAPLRAEILGLQRDIQTTNLEVAKTDLALAPEKKLELQLMNQFKAKQLEEAERKLNLAEQQQTRSAMYTQKLGELARNPNATASDYGQLAALMEPEAANSVRATFKMMGEEKAKNTVNFTAQLFSALNSNRVDVAKNLLNTQIEGLKNAGQDKEAEGWSVWSKMIDDPGTVNFAKDHFGILLSTMPEGEKAIKASIDLSKANKVAAMPEDVRKLVNTTVEQADKLRVQASSAADLSTRFEAQAKNQSMIGGAGAMANLGEFLKSQAGMQNGVTQLRKEYVSFRNSQAAQLLKDLRPASDTDVAMVLKGFLPETANMDTISKFLRGMAKVTKMQSDIETGKADWVGQVGTLGKAQSDLIVNGVTVPAGTSFTQFSSMVSRNSYIDDIRADYRAGRISKERAELLIEQAQKRQF